MQLHAGRGIRMNLFFLAMSIAFGVPLGGALGYSLNMFVFFHRFGIAAEILGAIGASALLYIFVRLHNQGRQG